MAKAPLQDLHAIAMSRRPPLFRTRMAFFLEPCYAAAMQITVNIPDEIAARAQARGQTPESYVESLIEDAEQSTSLPGPRRLRPEISMDEFLEAMTANSDKIPVLPDEAFTRESFYQDHD